MGTIERSVSYISSSFFLSFSSFFSFSFSTRHIHIQVNTMGFFHHESDEAKAHEEVTNSGHKAALSHELIAAAASYEAAKKYQEYQEKNGKPASHAKAKELLAAFSGAFVDHVVETKGLDFIDKEKAKHEAKKQAEAVASGDY